MDDSRLRMQRVVFGETLCELAEEFPTMVVLDADVSKSTQTTLFAEAHPERFFNFGIAEANMVGAAAGMATCSLIPVANTFAFLLTLRAGDPIRSLVAYPCLNVKLAGAYAGLSDAFDGASHQSVTDIAVMRALPNLTVLAPSDIESTQQAVRRMLEHQGPVYIRLSRDFVGPGPAGSDGFEIGRARVLRSGADVALVFCGALQPEVLGAADLLAQRGIGAAVVDCGTVKPLDKDTLVEVASKASAVVTIEEHNVIGGLGGAVAELLGEYRPTPMIRVGLQDCFGESGPYCDLREKHGLTAEGIVAAAESALRRRY